MPWFILRKRRIRRRKVRRATKQSKNEFKVLAPLARQLVHARLEHFNRHYKLQYKKVFIRNTRTRWGTCSALGNLSFNYRVAKLPPELLDYVVVHELCHLAHLNHSKAFWEKVAEALPHWKHLRTALKKIPIR
jgi:predicted metal-dependent hydrolase